MMAIEGSIIYNEVNAINRDGAKPVIFTWLCTVHANGKDVKPLYTVEMELDRNYIDQYCDKRDIVLAFNAGDFNYDIIPYKTNLEMTVRKVLLDESSVPSINQNAAVQTNRYRATLYDNHSPSLEGNDPTAVSREAAERGGIVDVRFQLLDLVVEQLRMQTIGGIYRNITGVDLVKFLLTKYSQTTVTDKAVTVKGVTVIGKPSKLAKEHLAIPHSTKVVDAPDIVNKNCGGIYSAGFKAYLQNQMWYLFPPYDLKGFKDSNNTLTLINIPANRLPSTERTYRETATQLFVLLTGQVKHKDQSEQAQLNEGNGVRFLDANEVLDGFATVENNKLTVNAANNVNEFVMEQRANGINNVQQGITKITANPLLEHSRLAQRSGAYIQGVWENSNDNLIYPGMPVKYMYLQNNTAVTLYGVVVAIQTHSVAGNVNVNRRRFVSNTAITIFVERIKK